MTSPVDAIDDLVDDRGDLALICELAARSAFVEGSTTSRISNGWTCCLPLWVSLT
jgi:hypothetical protein